MDRSSILRASTIPFVRKASLMSEAFFIDVQKGRPKSHIEKAPQCSCSHPMCNLERPFCTSGGDVRHLEGVHREGHVQGDDGGGGDLRGQRPA